MATDVAVSCYIIYNLYYIIPGPALNLPRDLNTEQVKSRIRELSQHLTLEARGACNRPLLHGITTQGGPITYTPRFESVGVVVVYYIYTI